VLNSLSAATVTTAHRQLLSPDRLTVLVVGDFDRKALREQAEVGFAAGFESRSSATTTAPTVRVVEPPALGPRAVVVPRSPHEGEGVLTLGFRLPSADENDALAAEVLAASLAQEPAGRLQTALIRNRHLVTSVDTFLMAGRDPGLLVFRARLGVGTLEEATQVAFDEIMRLGREELSSDEVARARLVVAQDNARSRGTLEGYVRRLGWSATVLGRPEGEEKLRDRLVKLSPASLRRTAASLFAPARATVVAYVPDGETRGKDQRAAALGARLATAARDTPARLDRLFAEHPPKPESLRRARGGATVLRRDLASGVHAVIVSDRGLPQVYARAVWSGGVRAEDARDFGAAQLLARVLAAGPRALSAEETDSRIAAGGGRLQGYADEDAMGVSADLLPDGADPALAILVESLRHPRFSDEDVEQAKRLLIARRTGDERQPTEIARRAFFGALWPRHPYRLDPRGSTSSLAALDRRRLLDHYRRRYPLSSLTFLVAGDVDAEQVLAQLDRWFGDKRDAVTLPVVASPAVIAGPTSARASSVTLTSSVATASAVTPVAAASPSPEGTPGAVPDEAVELFRTSDRDETRVLLGYRAPSRRDSDAAAAKVLWELLAGARGRLRTALSSVAPLAPARALWFEGVDGGAMAIDLVAPPDKLPDVVGILRTEMARFVAEGADAQEVLRAREWLVGRRSLAFEDRSSVFSAMAKDEALGLGLDLYRNEIDRLGQVQVADVNRVARTCLTPARQVLTVVQPAEGKTEGKSHQP
ncbi:MAG: insulinase family protein, partial [Catenulisporales bacterium]|nr:insulinase family protein [Catenulisporales bacterium]